LPSRGEGRGAGAVPCDRFQAVTAGSSALEPLLAVKEVIDMRLLVVIADELLGGDDTRDWAFLEALVAANSPDSIEVEVLALINEPDRSFRFSSPVGQVLSAGAGSVGRPPAEPYDATDSARQRLDRALQHLRSLGIRTAGEVATGDAYPLVRRRAGGGSYDRVLLVLTDRDSRLARLARHVLEARLRWVLRVPVQAVGHQEFALPVVPRQ
jgi:hypothetical protein